MSYIPATTIQRDTKHFQYQDAPLRSFSYFNITLNFFKMMHAHYFLNSDNIGLYKVSGSELPPPLSVMEDPKEGASMCLFRTVGH